MSCIRLELALSLLLAAGAGWPLPAAALPIAPPTPNWQPCALLPQSSPRQAECASVVMPRFHDHDDGTTIAIAAARVLAGADTAGVTRQLWFLNGGPGDSGVEALVRLAPIFANVPVDIYTLDHRGVGGSAPLECPQQQLPDSPSGREIVDDEWLACEAYLTSSRDDLDALTATQSARDLASLIEASATPGARVIVFGASYGTYWANRYLRLYPDQPDAVILDGLVPADWTMAEFDAGLATQAHSLLEDCGRQPVCREHLGDDPTAMATALPGRFDAGHCSILGIDGATIRLLLGNMLMGGDKVWPYIPPMVHRLDQCRWRDVFAIGDLFEQLFEEGNLASEPESHSQVLLRHVSLSELWPDPPPSPEALRRIVENAPMTTDVSAKFALSYDDWPRYPREPLFGEWADYQGPALLLHGSRDPTMPLARLQPMLQHYSHPRQWFVLVPDAGHVVLNTGACVRSIYADFLMNPEAAPDLSCIQQRPPLSLETLPAGTDSLFRTEDLWGDQISDVEILFLLVSAVTLLGLGLTVRWWRRRRSRRLAGS